MTTILVVDDEEPIRELLKFNLEKAGYRVILAKDGPEALTQVDLAHPDLLVLDLMLPGMDGVEVCRRLRQSLAHRELPIVMLTAKAEEVDKVLGLEMGADDYITKPFSPRELLARIHARLRRTLPAPEAFAQIIRGDLRIDPARFEVFCAGQEVELTPKEFELLRLLASHPGRVYTRDELLEEVWGYEYAGDTRTVDVHIRHIRQKLGEGQGGREFIETLRGVGYRFRS